MAGIVNTTPAATESLAAARRLHDVVLQDEVRPSARKMVIESKRSESTS